jgi:hypothetical protein
MVQGERMALVQVLAQQTDVGTGALQPFDVFKRDRGGGRWRFAFIAGRLQAQPKDVL